MSESNFSEYLTHCGVCGERKLTVLCDFPFNYECDLEEQKIFYSTCSLPLCDDCKKTESPLSFGDFCPQHWELWQQRHLRGDEMFRAHVKRQQLQGKLNVCEKCGVMQGCDPRERDEDWSCEECKND